VSSLWWILATPFWPAMFVLSLLSVTEVVMVAVAAVAVGVIMLRFTGVITTDADKERL
jgi:hypothetical protein